jgi:ABC-2 type transport system permease protein
MRSFMQPGMAQSLNITDSVMRPLFTNMSVVLLFFMPMLTMRLFAEEKKSGTMELLLTYPVRDGEVLAGKYLAAGALYVILLGLTLVYPGLIAYFTRIEWGPIPPATSASSDGGHLPRGGRSIVPDREPDRGRL